MMCCYNLPIPNRLRRGADFLCDGLFTAIPCSPPRHHRHHHLFSPEYTLKRIIQRNRQINNPGRMPNAMNQPYIQVY